MIQHVDHEPYTVEVDTDHGPGIQGCCGCGKQFPVHHLGACTGGSEDRAAAAAAEGDVQAHKAEVDRWRAEEAAAKLFAGESDFSVVVMALVFLFVVVAGYVMFR